jgi:small subunit ribosomal protein S18
VCENGVVLDYKRYQDLKSFVNRLGKILPRRATRLCAKHQRHLALEVRRARYMGLLAFAAEPEAMGERDRRRGGGRRR